ncbi:hypothetical protein DKY63_01965 [Pseudomonas putida]|uniref:Uncharacterized protein n=1 Tax=Pseudomonas putida TaxID=303 RepID=A0A2Z4RCN6_PSEPU|nr:hypothetical protein DKY63_01965 [Pseudomonas putida]
MSHHDYTNPVGASLLAMVVNDDAGCLTPLGALETIASRLAARSRFLRISRSMAQPYPRRLTTLIVQHAKTCQGDPPCYMFKN